MMNETQLQDEFNKQISDLLDKPNGLDMFCWLRRRASKLLECEHPDLEEVGSSDVTGKLYEVWKECHLLAPRSRITDSLGFQINSRVMEYIY